MIFKRRTDYLTEEELIEQMNQPFEITEEWITNKVIQKQEKQMIEQNKKRRVFI